MIRYLGIDPGKQGSIAWVDADDNGVRTMGHMNLPQEVGSLMEALEGLTNTEIALCVLEAVNAKPVTVNGKTRTMPATSAFNFGKGVGRIESTLYCLNIPTRDVPSGKWQKIYGGNFKGDKSKLLEMAQRLYPSVKITKRNADGVLIAHYAWRTETQTGLARDAVRA